MRPQLELVASVPRSTATISLRGTLSRKAAARLVGAVTALPQHVRSAHLDLARVRLLDVAALELLVEALRGWAADRRGLVSITPPAHSRAP